MRNVVLFVVMLSMISGQLQAGTTGKIMGTVRDAETRDPIPFANVLIEGTAMGAAADATGEYFIINVPVGRWTLIGRMMGYGDISIVGVWVSADMSTHMDMEMSTEVVGTMDIVEIVVERPMVDKGITASTKIIDGEAIEAMPVSDFEDVLAAQAGVSETGGARSSGMHVRGGRAGEVTYVVDGVNTTDPVTMGRGITIDNNAIAEMTLLSGGFNAEFGEAMSGVVNIITKEGGSNLHGGAEYYTNDVLGERYDYGSNDVNFNLGGPVPLTGDKGSFFFSGAFKDTDNRTPGILPKPSNDRKQWSGTGKLRLRVTPAMKFVLSGNWADNEYHVYNHVRSKGDWVKDYLFVENGNLQVGATLTHTVSSNTFYTMNVARFNTYRRYASQDGTHYNDWRVIGGDMEWVGEAMDSVYYDDGAWAWYDIENQKWHGTDEDGSPMTDEEVWKRYYEGLEWCTLDSTTGEILSWDNLIHEKTALNLRWYDTGYWDFSSDSSAIEYRPFDADKYLEEIANSDRHRSSSYEGDIDNWDRGDRDEYRHFYYGWIPRWHDRNTTHYTGDFSITHQMGKSNQLKGGAFVRKSTLELTELQFYNDNPYSDRYKMKPTNIAAFIQDKIEYEDLTVNLGVRWDYFDSNADYFVDMEDLNRGSTETSPKHQFSPRIGLSFAATDKSILYASYGHFFQPVELGELYQSLKADVTSGVPLLGNPDLPPEKTVAYEVGIKHGFTPDLAGEIAAYYKDVYDLLATREITSTLFENPVFYTIFLIEDFAVVKGVDLSLTKRASDYLSGTVTYSYLDAKGSGSSSREFYELFRDTETPLPKREYPLEFDVTHSLKANLNFGLPQDFGPELAGFRPLGDINAFLQFSLSTGAPYTPTDTRGNPGEIGSRRLSSRQITNLRIDKYFTAGTMDFGIFLDVRNLFDRENVDDVYAVTGEPDDDGYKPTRESYATEEQWEAAVADWAVYVKDPINYGAPRTMAVGVTVGF